MKVFVFGAGASRASQRQSENPQQRAPLVDEIFQDEYEHYAKRVLVGNELALCHTESNHAGSVEAWLTDRWRLAAQRSDQTKMAEWAFFGRVAVYVREVLQGVSNSYRSDNGYAQLLRKLRNRDEPFALLSFNYDTLLDRAVQDVFGKPLGSIDDYLSFPLFKLHGSVNWWIGPRGSDHRFADDEAHFDTGARTRQVTYGLFNNGHLNMNELRVLDPQHQDLNSLESLYGSFKKQYCYPLIFLPLTAKAYDQLEGFEKQLLQVACDRMGDATDVYLVGYRAADDIIHTVLRHIVRAPLHVVDRDEASAGEIQRRVLNCQRSLTAGSLSFGFKEFVEEY